MAGRSRKRRVAAAIVLVGAVLLIAALLTPWYSYESERQGGPSANFGTYNATYYLDPPSAQGAIHYSCYGQGKCVSQNSYASAGQNSTGLVAGICFFLIAMGGLLGVIAGIWGMLVRGAIGRTSPRLILAVLALLLGLAASVYFAAALPSAFSADQPGLRSFYSDGPWYRFSGSATFTGPYNGLFTLQFNLNWGPLVGWYLSIAGAVLLFAGVVLLYRYGRESPDAVPVSPDVSGA